MGIQQALIAAASIASASDPYWSQVKALLHFDGANGSTTITDSKGFASWSTGGVAAIATAQSKWGGASLFCGPSGDYVSTASDLSPGTVAFCIEFWWRPRSAAAAQYRTIFQGLSTGDMVLQTGSASSNALLFYQDGATVTLTESSGGTSDAWHFYKISRSGTSMKIERDGTTTATATVSSGLSMPLANGLLIGMGVGGGSVYGIDSWLDDFRLTVGTNRPGSGVPTAAFPNM